MRLEVYRAIDGYAAFNLECAHRAGGSGTVYAVGAAAQIAQRLESLLGELDGVAAAATAEYAGKFGRLAGHDRI